MCPEILPRTDDTNQEDGSKNEAILYDRINQIFDRSRFNQ
jgi:hypothetical protein